MTLTEGLATLFRARIKDSAISEDDTSGNHHTVAIGMHATVHTRGIVDDDTTHHRTAYRGRIGWKYPAVGLQDLIHASPHNAWLQLDGILIFADFVLLPMLACHDEHRVRTTLSAQRGACCTEGKGQLVFLTSLHDLRDLRFAITADDNLRNLTIKTGICSPSEGTELIGINTVRRQELPEVRQELIDHHIGS